MTKRMFGIISTLLTAVLVAANLVVANLWIKGESRVRVDLTEGKRYELSQGTLNILDRLDDTVTVKCYFSSEVPKRFDHVERVVAEKLQEYETASKGRVVYEFVDPATDPVVKQECEDLGIQPAQVQEFEGVQQKMMVCYMAMVFRYGDRKSILNLFGELLQSLEDPGDLLADLEFHITANIQKVGSEKKTIGLLATMHEVPQNPMMPRGPKTKTQGLTNLKRWLERSYDVKELDPVEINRGVAIPDEIDTLICVRPEGYTDVGRYVLDQFVMRGGATLFLVASGTVNLSPKQKTTRMGNVNVQDFDLPDYKGVPVEHGLDDLLGSYGVRIEPEFIEDLSNYEIQYVADRELKRNPFNGQIFANPVTKKGRYPVFVVVPARGESGEMLDPDQFARDVPIVGSVKDIVLPFSSPVTVLADGVEANKARARVLVRSGPQSWSRPIKDEVFSPDPATYVEPDEKSQKNIAILVEGKFRSSFDGKDIPTPPGPDGKPQPPDEELVKSRLDRCLEETSIFVMGNGDFVSDAYMTLVARLEMAELRSQEAAMAKPRAALSLINNAVHVLTYPQVGGDLIQIKDKSIRSREIVKLEPGDSRILTTKFVNIFYLPLAVLALGIVRWFVRRTTTGAAA